MSNLTNINNNNSNNNNEIEIESKNVEKNSKLPSIPEFDTPAAKHSSSSSSSSSPSPHSHLTFPSSSLLPDNCSCTYEDLRDEGLLTKDGCGVCGAMVGRHPRTGISHNNNNTNINNNNNNNSHSNSVVTKPSSFVSPLIKIKFDLPTWDPSCIVSEYLVKLKATLVRSGIDSSYWVNSFAFIMEKHQNNLKWVQTSLIDSGLSWTDACVAFTDRFRRTDEHMVLRRMWDDIKQHNNESIHDFSNRFVDILENISELKPDSGSVIYHFTHRMCSSMQTQYVRHLANAKSFGATIDVSTLDNVVKVCIGLDVTNNTINDIKNNNKPKDEKKQHNNSNNHSNTSNNSSAGTTPARRSGNKQKLHCIHHVVNSQHSFDTLLLFFIF
jgi:hypothetical protein